MFDLFRSRDKAVRILLTVLLGLVALSMVTYLIPGSGGGYGPSQDKTLVASIGKEEITTQDVTRSIQGMTRNRQLPPELLSIYVPQIVQQMINERVMAYEADRLGMKVTQEETELAVTDTLPPQLIKDGKVDTATLQAMLQQQGMSLAELKSTTARQLLINRLQQVVAQGAVVAPGDIEAEYRRRNEKVKLQYALLQLTQFQAQAEPTDAEIQSYYNNHKATFQTPEKRSYGIIVIDPARVAGATVIDDARLQSEYTSRRNEFQTPERVKVRHILLKADASNEAQIKPKAEALLKQIQGGGDFADLAKKNSQDPGSGAQGGELGYIVKGQTVPEFERAAFSLQPGQTSGLVKTTYGFHILQVEEHQQPHLQSFDEVKPQLLADAQKREGNKQMQIFVDKAIAELRKDPLHPEKAAAAVGVTELRADNVQAGDPIPGIGTSKEFDQAVAALRKGEVTAGPVVLPNGSAVVASVTDLKLAHPASLDEVRGEVRTKVSQQKAQNLMEQKAKDLLAKAQQLGGDLEKAAKELNVEVKTSPDVDRQGAIESVGTASSVPDAFQRPVGSVFGPSSVSSGLMVGKILSRTPANMAELPAQMVSIRDELRQTKARERATMFLEGLKAKLKADGKLKVNDDIIKRLVANYTQRS